MPTTDTPPAAPTADDYRAALAVLGAPCRMSACRFGDALCPICIASKVVARAALACEVAALNVHTPGLNDAEHSAAVAAYLDVFKGYRAALHDLVALATVYAA